MTRPRPKEGAVRESMREREAGERQTEERPAVSGAQPEEDEARQDAVEVEAEASAEPDQDAEPASEADEEQAAEPAEAEEQPEPEPAEPEEPLARAVRERGEYLELAQRAQADFENYRKRTAKELAAAGERAKAGLVRELLPVVDNLERALASARDDEQHLAEGVRLVHSELVALLGRSGIEGFDPTGERFDPTLHEALSTRPCDDADAGVVLAVAERGYMLNGNVLRPARVVVSA